VELVQLIFEVLVVIKMNFLLNRHAWNAFFASDLSKIFYLGYPVCPKTIFSTFSVSRQFIFHAFGLSKVYFYWLVMVWGWLFTDVDLVKVIFKVLGFIDMNFQINRHVWSALFCIRFVKSWFLGHLVSPKTIFSCSWWDAIQFSCVRFVQSYL